MAAKEGMRSSKHPIKRNLRTHLQEPSWEEEQVGCDGIGPADERREGGAQARRLLFWIPHSAHLAATPLMTKSTLPIVKSKATHLHAATF